MFIKMKHRLLDTRIPALMLSVQINKIKKWMWTENNECQNTNTKYSTIRLDLSMSKHF